MSATTQILLELEPDQRLLACHYARMPGTTIGVFTTCDRLQFTLRMSAEQAERLRDQLDNSIAEYNRELEIATAIAKGAKLCKPEPEPACTCGTCCEDARRPRLEVMA